MRRLAATGMSQCSQWNGWGELRPGGRGFPEIGGVDISGDLVNFRGESRLAMLARFGAKPVSVFCGGATVSGGWAGFHGVVLMWLERPELY